MNVNNNMYANLLTSPLTNVGAVGALTTSATDAGSAPSIAAAATATISTPGQLFSEMQRLSQQNPTQFKAVASQLATSFENAAARATGPSASFVHQLSNQFEQAAQTGSLQPASAPAAQGTQPGASAPSTGAQGAHHHHHHAGGGSSSAVEQAFQNAMSILTQSSANPATPSSGAASTSLT